MNTLLNKRYCEVLEQIISAFLSKVDSVGKKDMYRPQEHILTEMDKILTALI